VETRRGGPKSKGTKEEEAGASASEEEEEEEKRRRRAEEGAAAREEGAAAREEEKREEGGAEEGPKETVKDTASGVGGLTSSGCSVSNTFTAPLVLFTPSFFLRLYAEFASKLSTDR